MARKNLFGDVTKAIANAAENAADKAPAPAAAPTPQPAPSAAAPAQDRVTAPNVSYFKRGMQEEMRRTAQDVDPNLIDDSQFSDRLDMKSSLGGLEQSIHEHGQKIPVIIRPKEDSDRFEVVCGRRRIAACKKLGIMVRAMVSPMSDAEAILSQGIENNSRLETSFIERAHFMSQLVDAKIPNLVIVQTMDVDRTLISKMVKIYRDIPFEIIEAIGPAPGVGRRVWESLRACLAENAQLPKTVAGLIDGSLPSEERISALIAILKRRAGKDASKPARQVQHVAQGRIKLTRKPRNLQLSVGRDIDDDFLDYASDRIEDLLRDFEARKK